MATITAALVKELREATGAGMMDCKKALTESGGDIESAVDWLRQNGLSAAAKKSGRIASEGLVGIFTDGGRGAVAEVNSETDFVARNDVFQGFVRTVAQLSLGVDGDIETLKTLDCPGEDRTVEEQLIHLIATVGENMGIRRIATIDVNPGIVAAYVHNAVADGLGKIGVIVGLKSSADPGALAGLGKQLAMHIAAANPQSVAPEDMDPGVVEKERTFLIQQARESGRPEDIIEKMIEGRMRKFFEDAVLISQTFVIDGETQISQLLEQHGKELGAAIEISGFVRFELGDGLEKKEENFAAEVAAVASS